MNISDNLKKNIKSYSEECFPRESCGFIIYDQENYELIKTENLSKEPSLFEISPSEYIDIKNNYNIKYIYHNHIKDERFSDLDKQMAKFLRLNLLLYILDLDKFKIFDYQSREELWLK